MQTVPGGVTAPRGFRAAGVSAGVKKQGKDVALVVSDVAASSAAVFTTNRVQAAPVVVSKAKIAARDTARAIVVNSGNANACTGAEGLAHADAMCRATAEAVGLDASDVLVASTGVIGVPLPVAAVCAGIERASEELAAGEAAGEAAADAIRTTDTCLKQAAVAVQVDGHRVTIGGMAKGSGMIHPNMATMLGVLTTDAAVDPQTLRALLREAAEETFNMISVDGDTSTNDTVFALANGLAGNHLLTREHPDFTAFETGFRYVCAQLAQAIVRDGEGATKWIEVRVTGGSTTADARKLVKSILTSNLVKTAFFGEDANWGRILAAMGYSGAAFSVDGVSISFVSAAGRIVLMDSGQPLTFDEDLAAAILAERDIVVEVGLTDGCATATGWGCDLSYDYVRINGDYRT